MFEEADRHQAELAALNEAGAYVMGRTMFGPARDEWDLGWTGWWGPRPPYEAPVLVLTHHERDPVVLEGGTTFTFVTDVSSRRSRRRGKPLGSSPSGSPAVRAPSTSTSRPAWSTSCSCMSCRS